MSYKICVYFRISIIGTLDESRIRRPRTGLQYKATVVFTMLLT
jgi:hypothetical protein